MILRKEMFCCENLYKNPYAEGQNDLSSQYDDVVDVFVCPERRTIFYTNGFVVAKTNAIFVFHVLF